MWESRAPLCAGSVCSETTVMGTAACVFVNLCTRWAGDWYLMLLAHCGGNGIGCGWWSCEIWSVITSPTCAVSSWSCSSCVSPFCYVFLLLFHYYYYCRTCLWMCPVFEWGKCTELDKQSVIRNLSHCVCVFSLFLFIPLIPLLLVYVQVLSIWSRWRENLVFLLAV